MLNSSRRYSRYFKTKVLKEYFSTGATQRALERKYNIGKGCISNWLKTYPNVNNMQDVEEVEPIKIADPNALITITETWLEKHYYQCPVCAQTFDTKSNYCPDCGTPLK